MSAHQTDGVTAEVVRPLPVTYQLELIIDELRIINTLWEDSPRTRVTRLESIRTKLIELSGSLDRIRERL